MPQLDFTWWLLHLTINWTLWVTLFLALKFWHNTPDLMKTSNEDSKDDQ